MGKKLLTLALLLISGFAVFVGVSLYHAYQNTPERVVQRFVQNLSDGHTDRAYERLTSKLRKDRQAYWRDYLGILSQQEGMARLVRQERITDSFNTYLDSNDPRRFIYRIGLQDREYQLTILVIKEGRTWYVDELYGLYLK